MASRRVNRPIQALYVIDSLAPGGAERSLATVAPTLRERGVELAVAYLRERVGLHDEFRRADIELLALTSPERRGAWIRQVRRVIRDRRPDLVHTTLFEADVAGRVAAATAHVPVVTSLVNTTYGKEHLRDPRIHAWRLRGAQLLDAMTARLARRFHAVSETVADTMSRRLVVPRDRIDVVPRGRDERVLGKRTDTRRSAARSGLGLADGDFLAVCVARHEYQKGLDVLLASLPMIPQRAGRMTVAIVGREGLETPRLRAEIDRQAVGVPEHTTVRLLGVRDDVPDLLCAADAFVLPSRREGLPGAVIEAMALEAPIIASDLPEVREVIDDSCSLLVPAGEPDALASALTAIASDREGAATRAARARARFLERFTIERVADEMVRFYERALSPSR
jgi:glycosyltransferase involved in cell wall biosynthesis